MIEVAIQLPVGVNGWAGFGISSSNGLQRSDLAVGTRNVAGEYVVKDYWVGDFPSCMCICLHLHLCISIYLSICTVATITVVLSIFVETSSVYFI